MKLRDIIYVFIMSVLLTSCHSHRKVLRGDEVYDNKVKVGANQRASVKFDNEITSALLNEAYSWIGTPYKYGGNDRKGTDCSGLVMNLYKDVLNISLPRVSRDQGEYCKRIKKADLYPGDLVFFAIGKTSKVNHVGIYVGDGMMIHASSSSGVVVSDITKPYYVKHFSHCGRVEQYYEMVRGKNPKRKNKK